MQIHQYWLMTVIYECILDAMYQIWCKSDEPFWSYPVFGKFKIFVGGHLGFWKMTSLGLPLSGRHQGEAPHQIWWESVETFWRYSSFCKFQNCGAEVLSWIPLFSNCLPIFSFNINSSMLEGNLVHVAWTVQNVWCFVNFKFYLYFNMEFYCACCYHSASVCMMVEQ